MIVDETAGVIRRLYDGKYLKHIIIERNHKAHKKRHELVESMEWILGDMTLAEEKKLNGYLDKHLVYDAGRWMLDHDHAITWAVIRWNKDWPKLILKGGSRQWRVSAKDCYFSY
jgi:hypothetical protein